MVLATIRGTKVVIFLMGWICTLREYLSIKAAAVIEVLAVPF